MSSITLEYELQSQPRYGHSRPRHQRLWEILNRRRDDYALIMSDILSYTGVYQTIPLKGDPSRPTEPHWDNDFLPGFDIAALYYFICRSNPTRYLEVGSGNSTMVARRAIRDNQLRTTVVSIDPYPRAQIDEICDTVIRRPLEALPDLKLFEELEAGDILFFDSSHRVFMNSDVTVFFLEILPQLAPGVIVQIHDIFLPDDYPPSWVSRYYSEQYMLACCLLSSSHTFDVLLPCHFVSTDDGLRERLVALWNSVNIPGILPHGGSFWLRVR